jgi:acyl transferase domain-containing protein/NADPH:quinone reductase-like Zn-dependent oxidoreductase/acyl carrier protein
MSEETSPKGARPAATSQSAEKEALFALRGMRKKLDDLERVRREPIAIVGMACKIPGGGVDAESYWKLLNEKVDAVREIPPERFDLSGIYDPDRGAPGKTYSRWAGLLERVDEFDAEFFGISPREAGQMDPQQRLFLECAWAAIENAGIAPLSLRDSATGVFAGVTASEYAVLESHIVAARDIDAYSAVGLALNAVAGRVSYVLGLHGPSMSVDAACASSLVAIDRACRSLREDECRMALAGGVNVLAVGESLIAMSRWGMLSGSGRCRAFDAGADGFVRGEGCGVVVLKRWSEAERDGDRVLGVILGTAVNHDGASSGLTVPNGVAQAALLKSALKSAGVEAREVGYVEAHGTGTALGDPIEAEALGRVYGPGREKPLLIGSVKTNIGHLEAAAGVAGLIKVVLGLGKREIPGQLHWREPSPHVRWGELKLEVVTERRAWEPIEGRAGARAEGRAGGRRIAGVSSFGFSGTNAHVIVAEAPQRERRSAEQRRSASGEQIQAQARPVEVLALSAKTEGPLREMAERYARHLEGHREQGWGDVCYTAGVGRSHFGQRLALTAGSGEEGAALLRGWLEGDADVEKSRRVVRGAVKAGHRPRVGFLFTGQGSQYAGMGKELYAGSELFKGIIDRCEAVLGEAVLREELEAPLGAVMRGEHPESAKLLAETRYAQPALFALEYGLAELWRSWGVTPAVVLGHSVGEYAAAAIAGVMTLEEGVRLMGVRGRLMQGTEPGGMVALEATEAEARTAIAGREREVSLAAVNGARQAVISGRRAALEEIVKGWEGSGRQARWLGVKQGFHSPLMEPIAEEWERIAAEVKYGRPRVRLVSNLTGREFGQETVSGEYWRRHMREPVRFAEGITAAAGASAGVDVWVEIGPRPLLLSLAQQAAGSGKTETRWIASLRPGAGGGEWGALAQGVAEAYAAGVEIDWAGWDREQIKERVALPTYAFARERHWLTASAPEAMAAGQLQDQGQDRGQSPSESQSRGQSRGWATGHALLGERLRSSALAAGAIEYEQEMRLEGELAWVGEHRIGNRVLMPATGFVEMLLAAAERLPGWDGGSGATKSGGVEGGSFEDGRVEGGGVEIEELLLLEPLELAAAEQEIREHNVREQDVRAQDVSGLRKPARLVQVVVEGADGASLSVAERARIRVYSAVQERDGPSRDGQQTPEMAGDGAEAAYRNGPHPDAALPEPEWRLHAEGYVRRRGSSLQSARSGLKSAVLGPAAETIYPAETVLDAAVESIKARCPEVVDSAPFYAGLRERGADFGPRFRGVERVWRGAGEALGLVRLELSAQNPRWERPRSEASGPRWRLHPGSLDSCLQVAAALLADPEAGSSRSYLPLSIEGLAFSAAPLPASCFVHLTLLPSSSPARPEVSLTLLTPSGQIFARLERLRFGPVPVPKSSGLGEVYETAWVPLGPRAASETKEKAAGDWLILADTGAAKDAADKGSPDEVSAALRLAEEIARNGGRSTLVFAGDAYRQISDREFVIEPTARKQFSQLLNQVQAEIEVHAAAAGVNTDAAKLRIVHMWSLDAPNFNEVTTEGILASQMFGYGAGLSLIQVVVEAGVKARLFFVTRGAVTAGAATGGAVTRDAQAATSAALSGGGAALWALRRTLRWEHPEIRSKIIDLDGRAGSSEIADLLGELLDAGRPEGAIPEIAIRAAERLGPRLAARQLGPARNQTSTELRPGATGLLEDLHYEPIPRRAPADDEIEIEVRATGLNFRDVLSALGMLPGSVPRIGGECAGVLARAGARSGFKPGDAVLAFAPGSFGTYATVRASDAARKPAELSFAQAAALPIAYLTALYGLERLARIQPGESILIHSAAGGLGLAAVEVAKALGARVYATAGSEEKRAVLRSRGVIEVMNSRTHDFAQELLAYTDGRGVEVVLNSLSGEFIGKSMQVLAVGGRFLEVGKRGVLSTEEAAKLRPDVRYFLFDLGTEAFKDRELVPSLMRVMLERLRTGAMTPLPVETVSFAQAVNAFRKMAQARHIGKLVLTHESEERGWQLSSQDGTYLITGGLGALGLASAEWLVSRGARSLVLMSRHEHPEAEGILSRWRAAGVSVTVEYADCAERDALRAALSKIPEGKPLRGVIHCAGVLHDAMIGAQSWASFVEVAAPKITGTWNLHEATRDLPLDFFVAFSSAAAVLGSPGQANYAAVNAVMDSIMQLRRAEGLAGLSVNWGPWAGGIGSSGGMAANERVTARLGGIHALEPDAAFAILEELLARRQVQATVISVDSWEQWLERQGVAAGDPFFAGLRAAPRAVEKQSETFRARLSQEPSRNRRKLVIEHLQSQLAVVFGLRASHKIAEDTALFDLGLDSLMAVELRNALMKSLGTNLPATVVLNHPTIGSLADYLRKQMFPEQSNGEAEARRDATGMAEISDAEAEALLLQELEGRTNAI